MKKASLFLCLSFFACFNSQAQQPEEILNKWSERSPIEKVYLHLDRDNYMAGDIIWFKAYLLSDYLPDTISTSLYVELLDGYSTILSRKIIPVFFGNSYGQIELADSMTTGYYTIRAYSATMLNQDSGMLYKRSVFIYGKKKPQPAIQKEKTIRLEFFPESGNFVSDITNTVAFKATDENGFPKDVSGVIRNDREETNATFTSLHDGMGIFGLLPSEKEKYYAVLDGDLTGKRYELPASANQGIVFRVIPDSRGKYFTLQQRGTDPAFRGAYMIGQMLHHVVFRQEFSQNKDEITGIIKTSNLGSGILQITIFNANGIPLAERLSFIDNKEYIQRAELLMDTIDFSQKSRNVFSIMLPDTVQGSISVSVTDPDYDILSSADENIYSRFLLSSDLRGYIHNPAWYFSSDDDSVKNALDLVMMTNGWRRFRWTSLLKSPEPPHNYKDAAYISLQGRINIAGTRKPFANKLFVIFVTSPDSSRSMQFANTDAQGYFRLDSILFFDRSRLLFKDIRGKKSEYLEVNMGADSLARSFRLAPIEQAPRFINDSSIDRKLSRMAYDIEAIEKASGLMLKGITVKSRKKNPVEELEEKYVSGLFSGFSQRTIDLVHADEPRYEANIFDYLSSRVPGLSVMRGGLDYNIYYRQGPTASAMGAIPMVLYLDEVQTDASFISMIPANQIAMVKVFSSFVGAVGNGAGGALAIYTKKGSDLYNSTSVNDKVIYQGYSVIKEFYAPDYAIDPKAKTRVDRRVTLNWLSNIIVNNVNARIPVVFYNNDRTTNFRIRVEGMTISGKMISVEKIIPVPSSKRAF